MLFIGAVSANESIGREAMLKGLWNGLDRFLTNSEYSIFNYRHMTDLA